MDNPRGEVKGRISIDLSDLKRAAVTTKTYSTQIRASLKRLNDDTARIAAQRANAEEQAARKEEQSFQQHVKMRERIAKQDVRERINENRQRARLHKEVERIETQAARRQQQLLRQSIRQRQQAMQQDIEQRESAIQTLRNQSLALSAALTFGVVRPGIDEASRQENVALSLAGVTGSTEAAQVLMSEIADEAQRFALPITEAQEAAAQLSATLGSNSDELRQYIGLAARLRSIRPDQGLDGAAFALNEAISSIRSGNFDLVSLAERFNVSKIAIREAYEETGNFAEALDIVLDQMGRSEEVAIEFGNTLSGSMALMGDSIRRALGSLFAPYASDIARLAQATARLAEQISEMDEGTRKIIGGVVLLGAAIGPVTLLVGQLAMGIQAIQALAASPAIARLIGVLGPAAKTLGIGVAAIAVGMEAGFQLIKQTAVGEGLREMGVDTDSRGAVFRQLLETAGQVLIIAAVKFTDLIISAGEQLALLISNVFLGGRRNAEIQGGAQVAREIRDELLRNALDRPQRDKGARDGGGLQFGEGSGPASLEDPEVARRREVIDEFNEKAVELERDTSRKLVDIRQKTARRLADIDQELADSQLDSRRDLRRNLQTDGIQTRQSEMDALRNYQRDEERALREHTQSLRSIRENDNREAQEAARNRDFSRLFDLRETAGNELGEAQEAFDQQREERAIQLAQELEDIRIQAERQREERFRVYAQEVEDNRIQASRKRRDARQQAAREREDALKDFRRRLQDLFNAKMKELNLLNDGFNAELQLYQQASDARLSILQNEVSMASRMFEQLSQQAAASESQGNTVNVTQNITETTSASQTAGMSANELARLLGV